MAYRVSKYRVGPITSIIRKLSGRNSLDLRSLSGCMEQRLEISQVQAQLDNLATRMELERGRVEDLQADAGDALFEAAISIALSALAPLAEAAAIARALAVLRDLRVLTRHDVQQLAAAVFPLLGVIHGLARYAQDIREIANIQERLQEYHDDSVNLGLDLLALTELAQEDGCLDPATS